MKKNDVKINEIIKKEYGKNFQRLGVNYTSSSLFALPMLNIAISRLGKYFLNCFVKDSEYDTIIDRPMFLLFKYEYKDKEEGTFCKKIHNELIAKKEFITYYYVGDINDSKSIMYLFNVDEEFDHDYRMFLDGKYSHFRPEFKEKFPKYYVDTNTHKQEKTIVGQVLFKSKELKKYWSEKLDVVLTDEDEVWSRPYIEEIETL